MLNTENSPKSNKNIKNVMIIIIILTSTSFGSAALIVFLMCKKQKIEQNYDSTTFEITETDLVDIGEDDTGTEQKGNIKNLTLCPNNNAAMGFADVAGSSNSGAVRRKSNQTMPFSNQMNQKSPNRFGNVQMAYSCQGIIQEDESIFGRKRVIKKGPHTIIFYRNP
ncbi:hypothetical protein EDEG_02451 [Edhazardia aedis USNM 41457]|uniref:Uncharacterized protein n=1 Tax=Edhazardia aedis (strain USNM 41457) TaxID=1003232 RepID=J8ZU58_EDHAE|nr:hypothetical protein EDEG_02451 [Edhazardia aedis USNM 41457]|eukprot:EJW03198.1 hypothetical protein EDEG_02451 [Edhazardia aedis USNM 41457]